MKSDEIANILGKHIKKIQKHFNNLLEEFELEEIHDYRLEIKKLRAFMRLLNAGQVNGARIKIGGDMKSFYNTTGNIRNIQLQNQRINRMADKLMIKRPAAYLNVINSEAYSQKEKARQIGGNFSLNIWEDKIMEAIPAKLRPADLQKYMLRKRQSLLSLLMMDVYYDDALHQIRKELKDVMYNRIHLNNSVLELLPAYFKKKNIELMTTKLGDFHDLCVGLYYTTPPFLNQLTDANEKEEAWAFEKHLSSEKELAKYEIITLLSDIKQRMEAEHVLAEEEHPVN